MQLTLHKTEIDGYTGLTVDGRELHTALEVGKHFVTWIKGRIAQFGFVEGVDFTISDPLNSDKGGFYPKRGKTSAKVGISHDLAKTPEMGGRPTSTYLLTMDMAKELSMVEKTDAGRVARKYFIECERKLMAAANSPAPQIRQEPKEPIARFGVSVDASRKQILQICKTPNDPYQPEFIEFGAHLMSKNSIESIYKPRVAWHLALRLASAQVSCKEDCKSILLAMDKDKAKPKDSTVEQLALVSAHRQNYLRACLVEKFLFKVHHVRTYHSIGEPAFVANLVHEMTLWLLEGKEPSPATSIDKLDAGG